MRCASLLFIYVNNRQNREIPRAKRRRSLIVYAFFNLIGVHFDSVESERFHMQQVNVSLRANKYTIDIFSRYRTRAVTRGIKV